MSQEMQVEGGAQGGAHGFSRRTMLKAGVAGGVAVWAVPAVEMVGTKVAAAQSLHTTNCSLQVSPLASWVPASGTNSVTLTYNTSTASGLTESFTIDSGGNIAYNPPTPAFSFSFVPDVADAILASSIPTGELITMINVTVQTGTGTVTATSPTGYNYGPCSLFTLQASS